MELLINDLSICGQFQDIASFRSAITRVMKMREIAQQYGREIYCHKNMCQAQVTNTLVMQQAIQHLSQFQRSALMQWLTRHGPYWEDDRIHSPDDYLECNNQIVTDTAIGETAFRCFNGSDHRLVSLIPSSWEITPLSVHWHNDDADPLATTVTNYTITEILESDLRAAPPVIETWEQLAQISKQRYPHLTFTDDSFAPFKGFPFTPGPANRIIERLEILERLKRCYDETGVRTPEGHRIYQEYFTGDKAWFSDSSNGEKHDFEAELTFKHPDIEGETLFCTWHGKVKTPQLRIHFSWPINPNISTYVVYVGPKITKR